jgi:chromate transporter
MALKIFFTFLKLGFVAFGGPLAHIALFEDVFVSKEKWLDHQSFLNYLGLTHLIPGPNSTEMAMFIGFHRGGFLGLLVSGLGFLLPSLFLTILLGLMYQEFKDLDLFIVPFTQFRAVIIGVVIHALYKLFSKIEFSWKSCVVGIVSIGVLISSGSVIITVLSASLSYLLLNQSYQHKSSLFSFFPLPVFKTFFYIGSILVGSGYVLIAYVQDIIVEHYHWITQEQLIDAVAIGQITPGPILATAAVIGLFSFGIPGAIAAAVGIFLPSFLLTMVISKLHERLKNVSTVQYILNGAIVGSLVVMAKVTIILGLSLSALFQGVLLLLSVVALFILKWRPVLVMGCGAFFSIIYVVIV